MKLLLAAAIVAVSSSTALAAAETGAVAVQAPKVKLNFVFGQPYYDKPSRDRPYQAPPYSGR